MTGFWIVTGLLVIAGYSFFIPALLVRGAGRGIDRKALNLALFKQRRQELLQEATEAELGALEAEASKDLLGELGTADATPAPSASTKGRVLLGVGMLAAPALASFLYFELGRPDLANFHAEPQAVQQAQQEPAEENFKAMIDKLAERLKKEPNDLEGWLLLGRSLVQTDQIEKALEAYESAMKIAPDNLDVKALYAQALSEGNDGSLAGRPAEIVAEILAKNPKHMTGLWLAGLAAAEKHDAKHAAEYWEQLKAQFAPDSDDAKQLAKYIAKVKGEPIPMDEAPVATAAAGAKPDAKPAAPTKSIKVKVTLNDAVKAKAAPEDTVFIFARAASGPPMPLAIVRKQVRDLPIEVTLDDTMSMMPGMNIAAFEQLVIGARVSKTGKALPAPGDIQGLSAPTSAKNGDSYSIDIAQEVQ